MSRSWPETLWMLLSREWFLESSRIRNSAYWIRMMCRNSIAPVALHAHGLRQSQLIRATLSLSIWWIEGSEELGSVDTLSRDRHSRIPSPCQVMVGSKSVPPNRIIMARFEISITYETFPYLLLLGPPPLPPKQTPAPTSNLRCPGPLDPFNRWIHELRDLLTTFWDQKKRHVLNETSKR